MGHGSQSFSGNMLAPRGGGYEVGDVPVIIDEFEVDTANELRSAPDRPDEDVVLWLLQAVQICPTTLKSGRARPIEPVGALFVLSVRPSACVADAGRVNDELWGGESREGHGAKLQVWQMGRNELPAPGPFAWLVCCGPIL